MQHIYN